MVSKIFKVVFLDRSTFESSIKLSRPSVPHHWEEYPYTEPEQVVERVKDAEIIIVNKVVLSRQIIDQLPKLQLISVTATGIDNIDLEYCREKNIVVTQVKNYGTPSIAEHTLLLILALRRKLYAYREAISTGKWNRSRHFCYYDKSLPEPIQELRGSRLGIVGAGTIGKEVGRMGKLLGMDVCYFNRSELPVDLSSVSLMELLKISDVVSIHLPLTDVTRNLIGEKELNQMKSSAILINTARGGIVDEKSLALAIRKRRIAGIGFDVLSEEPPRESREDCEGNPLLELVDEPNVIITPHIAWAGKHSAENLIRMAMAHVDEYIREKTT